MEAAWEKLLPRYRGRLPGGGELVRTDPGGASKAHIAILGLSPDETRSRAVKLGRERLLLPAEVEARSFEGSASGVELREKVLLPLGLRDDQVCLLHAYPYYLASDLGRGDRSTWTQIRKWRAQSGETDDVQERPMPSKMAEACRALPGNLDRLADQLKRCQATLLLTIGAETAALVRGFDLSDAQRSLYAPAETREVFGQNLVVVHLAWPGIFLSPLGAHWRARHEAFCAGEGAALVARQLKPTQ